MQLEALRVFCDVVRCRSFSQAARQHHMTQSAASQIVSQLEKHLKVRLIDRSTRPLQVTAIGQHYYSGCRSVVEQYLELEASIRSAHAELEATVEVAAIYSVGLGDMGKIVERFAGEHPGARVHVEYLHPDRVHERVLDGAADFGLVSFPRASRKLDVLPWREEVMVVACAPSHRLAHACSVEAGDLADEKFVAFDRALPIRRHIDRYLREQGVQVAPACEFDTIENIKKAVEEGAGVAILPEVTFRREARAGAIAAVRLTGEGLVRPLGIIFRRGHPPAGLSGRFLARLRGADAADPALGAANGDGPHAANKPTRRGRNGTTRA